MMRPHSGWDRIPRWAQAPAVHRIGVPLAIMAIALALRVVYLWEDSASPFFLSGGVDSPTYLRRAASLISGHWPGPFAFEQPPLYPAWLAALSVSFGNDPVFVKLAQAILGSISCVLLYFVAKKSFRDFSVALLAASVCALNGTLIYFDGQIVSASLEVFLQCGVLLLLLHAAESDRLGWWFLAGCGLGLSAMNRGEILVCLPFVLFWIYKQKAESTGERRAPRARRWKPLLRCLLVVAPVAACVLAIWMHNFQNDFSRSVPDALRFDADPVADATVIDRLVQRDFVLLTSLTGMNLHLGNVARNYEYNDPNHPKCFVHTNHVMKLAFRSTGAQSASAQQRFMVGLTLETIGEDPGAWLRLMGRKVLELLNGIEIPRNANLYADRQYSAVLSTLLWHTIVAFPAGVIIPLGVLGLYLDRRQWRRRFLLSAFLLPRAGFLLAFFTAARLRLPLIPLLTIFATYAACELFRRTQKGEFREIRGAVALLALLVLIGNAPIAPARAAHGAYEFFVLGNHVRDQVGVEAALPHYRRAVVVDPDSPGANFLLGLALTQLNRPEEANGYLGHAAQLDAGFVEPRVRLGQNLNRLGRTEQAVGHLRDALAIDPNNLRVQTMLEKLGFATEKAL